MRIVTGSGWRFGFSAPLAIVVLCALSAACSSRTTVLSDRDGAGGVPSEAGTGAGLGLTIDNCETSFESGVPDFYRTYFRCVHVAKTANGVRVESKGLPPHLSNYYVTDHPNYEPFDTSRGSPYRANPNRLGERVLAFEIPDEPTAKGLAVDATLVDGVAGSSPLEFPMGPVGVALDSVALFNALAAPGDDIENERFTFDRYDAHPAPDGTYHYHSMSMGPLEVLARAGFTVKTTPGEATVELYGILCDGTLVLGCTELGGESIASGPLDAQGGHAHAIQARGVTHFASRYHVHLCPGGRTLTPEIQVYTTCAR